MYWRLIIIALALVLQSCAAHKVPAPAPVVKRTPKDVVILVSENIPAYSSVAVALARDLGKRASVLYLAGSTATNNKILAGYRDDEHKQFVSIGLRASIAAKTLANRQVVFCQVFNYQEYELITDLHKGVSMIPSMSKIFGAWRELAPDITDIGVISGPDLDDMIQTARAAARENGITLHHETVNFDKEYQYAYKQMADRVQGFWLLPDNRVLSETVLRDVMTFSMRNGKQVAVSNDELLNLGGLFTISNDYDDVARTVMGRLEQAQDLDSIPGPDIVYPGKLVLHVNPVMVERLNLKLSDQFKKHENVF
jgi:ABC-type uncharacterized transport system substrate-binding protein